MAVLPRHIHCAGRINGVTLAITHLAGCGFTVARSAGAPAGDYTITLTVAIDDTERQVNAWPFTQDDGWVGCTVGGTGDTTFNVRFFAGDTPELTDGTFLFQVERMYS